jgi:PHD/YefM family antitoxin component YafN of YafNO toxin-antitoxin module
MSNRTQFVTNEEGRRVAVLLDVKTYERLQSAADELSDIRAYDASVSRVHEEVCKGACSTLADYLL